MREALSAASTKCSGARTGSEIGIGPEVPGSALEDAMGDATVARNGTEIMEATSGFASGAAAVAT